MKDRRYFGQHGCILGAAEGVSAYLASLQEGVFRVYAGLLQDVPDIVLVEVSTTTTTLVLSAISVTNTRKSVAPPRPYEA